MKFIERVKDIFQSFRKTSDGFIHNADYDTIVLRDYIKERPQICGDKEGRLYVCFNHLDADEKRLLNKMGFNVKLYKSIENYYTQVYRARVSRDLKPCAKAVIDNLLNRNAVIAHNYENYKSSAEYARYIINYGMKTK